MRYSLFLCVDLFVPALFILQLVLMLKWGELAAKEYGGLLFICDKTLSLKLLVFWPALWFGAAELFPCSSPSEPPETASKFVLMFIRFLFGNGIETASYMDEVLLSVDAFCPLWA